MIIFMTYLLRMYFCLRGSLRLLVLVQRTFYDYSYIL